ncbi:MAG: dTMP kinase [Caldiserica bacterium]|nr:MAG: dTMP kinase [Caldisericota bacterium]
MRGIFLTVEGIDGCGKTTQAELLQNYLIKKGFPVIKTREPGGTSLAEDLRNILLSPKNLIYPMTELLLYAASRAQHTQELIKPSLENGKIVICERYIDASLAYQGYGRGIDLSIIERLNEIATEGLKPDITILFDIDVERAFELKRRNSFLFDRLEMEEMEFHKRVRNGYLEIAKKEKRFRIIKVDGSVKDVHNKVIEVWEEFYRCFLQEIGR